MTDAERLPPESLPKNDSHWLRAAVDFGALVAFGAVYLLTHDLLKATWAIVAGSAVAIAVGLAVEKRLAPLPLIIGLFALVFGGLTLITHDTRYLKMEGSFLYAALGLGLLVGSRMGLNPLKELLGSALHMPPPAWRTLTIRYALFFLALGIANEAVNRLGTDALFAKWKIAKFVISLVFSLAQAPFLMKYATETEPSEDASKA
ncbi:MAG: inner membrane-spanning protein YciB [Caulobacteraceae bacterium]